MDNTRQQFDFQGGEVLVFNKPLEWTSFDLVRKVRNTLCRRMRIRKLKVGHAGTLDPMATGVMVLCTGKSTRKIESLQAGIKEYVATLKLGATTPSYDLETEENETFPIEHITRELVDKTIGNFVGEIDQVPPEFSAVWVDGKRAYELARKGEEVKLKSRKLVIDSIDVISLEEAELKLRIVCSKGTYIRALARDIGKALESGAYLTGLERTRVGDFRLEEAMELESFMDILKEAEFVIQEK